MPRSIDPHESIASIRSEIRFTRARIKHEPHAAAAVTIATDRWNDKNDALEAELRSARDAAADAEAAYVGASDELDQATVAFADALHADMIRTGEPGRLHAFIRTSISDRGQPRAGLRELLAVARAWLERGDDPILEQHREALAHATARGEQALRSENAAAARAVCVAAQRELFAGWLTAERNALHEEFGRVARTHRLGRGWADSFFRNQGRAEGLAPLGVGQTAISA